jgi:DNA-binding transcriptional MerR regulator
LRHYDDVGLLPPAQVDHATGYRRYRRGQVQSARLIQALRWIDLPVEEVRRVLADPTGDEARGVLSRHRDRLTRQAGHMAARIADTERYLEEGISMPVVAGCRPAQIKVAVDDTDEAIGFYREAFGFRYDVTRRTQDADYSSFVFGTYGQADFFLLHRQARLPVRHADHRPVATLMGKEVEHVARLDLAGFLVNDSEERLQVEGDSPNRVRSGPPGDELQVAVEQRMAEREPDFTGSS